MPRYRILDLYCGAGGAAVGYHRAGFEVVGIDINPQPDYPFEFHQSDALTWLAEHGTDGFDAIHASPPCQRASALTKGTQKYAGRDHPNWIPQTRRALKDTGLPYVIENVIGSDLRKDLILCGEMFGLDVVRHRYFELGLFRCEQPQHPRHRGRVRGWEHGTYYDGPYRAVYGKGGAKGKIHEWQDAMGIDWTAHRRSIAEAIPPAYTAHIGTDLAAHVAKMSSVHRTRPKLLDLYCGQGGAAIGYTQAGFDVVGVDHEPGHRRYYPYRFIAANAIGYLLAHGAEYDLIHASPPCQRYSAGNRAGDRHYPDLVAPTRRALEQIGVPWIIENVEGAPLDDPVLLCGTMFDLIARDTVNGRSKLLHLHRHRLFESPLGLTAPKRCSHLGRQVAGIYTGGRRDPDEARHIRKGGYTPADPELQDHLMGTDWHGTRKGLREAIPPAYTNWLGSQAAILMGQ